MRPGDLRADVHGSHPRKSLALTDLFIALVEQRCASHPLGLVTPREHARRGSQVSFTHPHGYAVMQALIARGVIGDYREPAIMRFGFTPLYTSFADVWHAVEILRDILDRKPTTSPPSAMPSPEPPMSDDKTMNKENSSGCPMHAGAQQGASGTARRWISATMSYGDYLALDQILTPSTRCRPTTTRCCSSCSTRPANCG
jgi:hypothetical protein